MSKTLIRHPVNQSPFFRLSKHKLPGLLSLDDSLLKFLCGEKNHYDCWDMKKKGGDGFRKIESPKDNLKKVQKRIADLLQRINPPSYLMAPVKKRSYVDNAAHHLESHAFRLLDLENFFPSCTDKRVFWFFNTYMKCPKDVAAILTKITTFAGHLPQGSPCSPILAYFSYINMWEEIYAIAIASNYKISFYIDDITISSSATIYERDIWTIKQVFRKYGLKYSAKKERSVVRKPVMITGVVVHGSALLLPNRQHKKISQLKKLKHQNLSFDERRILVQKLTGCIAQSGQIQRHKLQSGSPATKPS